MTTAAPRQSVASVHAEARFDLGWLISPTEPQEFWSSYWEQAPLVIHRGDPSYYHGLLSLADVDNILATSAIRPSDIRVVKSGKQIPLGTLGQAALPGGSHRLEGLYREYRAGATIVIQSLHERWGPLGQLCRRLGHAVSGAAQANIYLTPAGETGLLPHYDTHDVMVLQTSGSKHWRIFGRPIEAPTKDQPYERSSDPGPLTRDFVMEAGDFMYLPRGYMHVAESRDQASLHVTVGIHPVTAGAVLRVILETAIRTDPRFRRALAPGFANDAAVSQASIRQVSDLLATLAYGADTAAAVEEASKWAAVSEKPALEGHLLDLEALKDLGAGLRLRIRPGLTWRHDVADGKLVVAFNGKRMSLPDHVAPCLTFMEGAPSFAVHDLPDNIDAAGKLVLCESLLREGFLTAG